MKVLTLPFTKKNGITVSSNPDFLLQLDFQKSILNHLGTVHASASYALAETSSGYFLQKNFSEIADQTIPILRSSNIKYKKAGQGILFSTAKFIATTVKEIQSVLLDKRKVQLTIQVKLYNEQEELVMLGEFEWFVTLK